MTIITRRHFFSLLAATIVLAAGLAAVRARALPRVATGFVASLVCSSTFVSKLEPHRVMAETLDAMLGMSLISWGLHTDIDRARKAVTVTLFGFGRSRSVYRDGLGCALEHDGVILEAAQPATDGALPPALLPDIAGPLPVAHASPQLEAALDHAFAEPEQPPFRHTRAVVVVKDGRIVAERYADGVGVDTQILGFSMTKSVIAALTGILVRQGKLTLDQPAPVAAWRSEGDPRHAITVDHLLRHTAGLAMGSSLEASLGAALEPVNRMKFMEPDMAAFAERAPLATSPGTVWNYHDGNYLILSRLIRDVAGGHAQDVLRFVRRELFGPLGMNHVTLEFDATGTPEGSSQMFASARDWARFGMLYLDDGVVGGKRILPEGWVHASATPTPNAWVGYGAGFWTNGDDSRGATYRVKRGWPREAFFAKGTIGQYVIVVPSQRLVIARLGVSPNWPDVDGVSRLISDVIAATHGQTQITSGR